MDIIFRLLNLFLLYLDALLKPIFWAKRWRTPRKVPPIDNQVLLLSATDLAKKIRERKLTSLYVVATYIGRIKQVNPILNAVSDDRFDAALVEAKDADDFIANTKLTEQEIAKQKPFLGVPISVKESLGVKGMSHAVGTIRRKNAKCDADGASVHRLRKAGFIPLVVTNCPEYCSGLETNNLLIGATNNPFNTHYSVGGSSGGEAALISSGASVVGIASDYAGSIRLPSSFTGIFGHKTSPKIVPRTMHYPNSSDPVTYEYFGIGPMCRYASDLKPIIEIISAEEGKCLNLNVPVNLKDIKVLLTEDYYNLFGVMPVSLDIIKGIYKTAKLLKKECQMHSEVVKFDGMEICIEIGTSLFLDLKDRPNFLEDFDDPKKNLNLYKEFLKSFMGTSKISIYCLMTELIMRFNGFIPKSHLDYYKIKMNALQKDVWNKLGDNAVLLFPAFSCTAFQHYQIFTKTSGITYSMIFNILGCPSTLVPIGLDANGFPIGIQVIAGPKQDRLCLAVAEAIEKYNGGWISPV